MIISKFVKRILLCCSLMLLYAVSSKPVYACQQHIQEIIDLQISFDRFTSFSINTLFGDEFYNRAEQHWLNFIGDVYQEYDNQSAKHKLISSSLEEFEDLWRQFISDDSEYKNVAFDEPINHVADHLAYIIGNTDLPDQEKDALKSLIYFYREDIENVAESKAIECFERLHNDYCNLFMN